MSKTHNPVLFIGVLGLLTIGSALASNLAEVFWGNRDIWWTHAAMPLALNQTSDRFQVIVAGKPLNDRLQTGQLFLQQDDGALVPLVAADVTARVNNWQEESARKLLFAVPEAFIVGACVMLVAWGLVSRNRLH